MFEGRILLMKITIEPLEFPLYVKEKLMKVPKIQCSVVDLTGKVFLNEVLKAQFRFPCKITFNSVTMSLPYILVDLLRK